MRKFLVTILTLLGCLSAFCDTNSLCGVVEGDRRLGDYIHLLQGKRVGILTNQTAMVDGTHIVDTLIKRGVEIKRIFTPESGFRCDGTVRYRDSYLGIEIITLCGEPKANDVFGCDIVVCDIQDAGIRWSPELRALVRMMQVCGDIGVPLMVLDRPNPFGGGVDGAIVESQFRSECMLPIPILHGMTLGEVAMMVNGEGWLSGGARVALRVIPCHNHCRDCTSTADVLSRGLCVDVPTVEGGRVTLSTIVAAYAECNDAEEFFVGEEFDRMMGTKYVREMIAYGYTAAEIESMWRGDVEQFKSVREKYLIYEN